MPYFDRGRYWLWKPKHPRSNPKGFVKRARIVMEEHLKRYLKPTEIVHHKNGDISDDKIENLEIMTIEEHNSLHHAGSKHKYPKRKRQRL